MSHDFWNSRYASRDFVYGIEPNNFLKDSLSLIKPGKLLLPAEGEGRNAVFAAKLGFQVTAFDTSIEGMKKALQLAKKNEVNINYLNESYESIDFPENTFDAVALIFAHMPPAMRREYHRKLISFLHPDGLLILQGFSKDQINYSSGGPREIDLLFSEEELAGDFSEMKKLEIKSELTLLSEGEFHQGPAAVINLLGNK
jgi:SAM-dependent methyltransferase